MLLWIVCDPLLKPVDSRGFGVDDKLSGVRLQRAKHPGRLVETKPCGYYSILFWLFKWQIPKNGVKVKILYNQFGEDGAAVSPPRQTAPIEQL